MVIPFPRRYALAACNHLTNVLRGLHVRRVGDDRNIRAVIPFARHADGTEHTDAALLAKILESSVSISAVSRHDTFCEWLKLLCDHLPVDFFGKTPSHLLSMRDDQKLQ